MITLPHTYANNGYIRSFIVLSATAGDEAHTAIIHTADEGCIAVSLEDTPDLYNQLISSGLLA